MGGIASQMAEHLPVWKKQEGKPMSVHLVRVMSLLHVLQ